MLYAIDFDGTIVTNKFPDIGEPIMETIVAIKEIQRSGNKWILWTMREGEYLEPVIPFLNSHGLFPECINDNLPELKEAYGNNPRKVYADVYIDDHNAGGLKVPRVPHLIAFGGSWRGANTQ